MQLTKNFLFLIIALLVLAAGFLAWKISFKNNPSATTPNPTINTTPMKITSPAFLDNQSIPQKYTCDGDGINPPLEFSNVPKGAKSLALTVRDPDAPMGTWTHWTVWNIDPAITSIAENFIPTGAVQGQTSSGQNIYGGPCPPSGTHHYIFTLYALSGKPSIPSYTQVDDLLKAIQPLVISQAELVGLYSRNK